MRVLLAIRNLYGQLGGAERAILSLAGGLAARGHDACIIHYDDSPGEPFYPVDPRVRLVNLSSAGAKMRKSDKTEESERSAPKVKKQSALRSFRRKIVLKFAPFYLIRWFLRNRRSINTIRDFSARFQPDIAVGFMPYMAAHCAAALRRARIPVIFSMRSSPEFNFGPSPRRLRPHYDVPVYFGCLRRYSGISVLLPVYRDWFPPRLRGKVHYIPNEVRAATSQRSYDSTNRQTIILFVGRLVAYKRPGLLVDAWAKIHERFPDWQVHFYGAGPEKSRLEQRVCELGLGQGVKFMGVTKDIESAYTTASIFSLPSRYEGFPRALSEAMAHGVPSVGFDDCEGVKYLLSIENAGLLVDHAKGADGLSAALAKLIENPALRDRLSAGARDSMKAYDSEHVFNAWEEYLARIVSENRR